MVIKHRKRCSNSLVVKEKQNSNVISLSSSQNDGTCKRTPLDTVAAGRAVGKSALIDYW